MSFLENTPFSLVTVDSKTGENLSAEALENRERLILLWKIQQENLSAFALDLNDSSTQCEEALTGDEFIELLRSLIAWHKRSLTFPILKQEVLRNVSAIRAENNPKEA